MARPSPLIRDGMTLVYILRGHPEWTLAQAFELAPAHVLEVVRVGDLMEPIDFARLTRAKRLSGADFDACVLSVIREAGQPVAASYLRDRVGGPRWKLQAATGRLVKAGKIERDGTTGGTRYRWPGARNPTP